MCNDKVAEFCGEQLGKNLDRDLDLFKCIATAADPNACMARVTKA